MASTYTDELRLELQADGENDSTWGQKANTVFQLIEDAISGAVTINTTGGTTTLSNNNGATDQARMAMIKVTGTLSSGALLRCPAQTKAYYVWNATSGSYNVTMDVSGGTAVTIAQGEKCIVFTDGTDFYHALTATDLDMTDNTLVLPNSATPTQTTEGSIAWDNDNDQITVGDGTSTLTFSDDSLTLRNASTTQDGQVEIATAAETTTGTDATRAVSPDGLAGSTIFGVKTVEIVVVDYTTDTATGDGKAYFHVPASLNGMNLVGVHAEVITAGTTGTTDIQIHNVTDAVDMLSTKLTIDSTETGSDTAATAAVINTSNDDVATNDLLRIDVDAVSTTAAKGLIVTMDFQLP